MRADWIAEAKARESEPLHPDLVPWLDDSGFFGQSLRHPLVYDIPHIPQMAWRCNDQYRHKTEALEQAIRESNWHSAIWLHERPHRHAALARYAKLMDNEVFWRLLGEVWGDTENLWQWGNDRRLIASARPGREHLMTSDEQDAWSHLSDVVVVWRGFTKPGGTRLGWSWTTDRERGVWFARRWEGNRRHGILLRGMVARKDVLAYFLRRNESEIVVSPGKVRGVIEERY